MLTANFPARHDHLKVISSFVMDAIKDSPLMTVSAMLSTWHWMKPARM